MDGHLTTQERTPLLLTDLLGAGNDADGDPLSIISVNQPTHGVTARNEEGAFVYTPTEGFKGEESIT